MRARRWTAIGIAVAATLWIATGAGATMLSKEYVFKPHVELRIGAEVRDDRHAIRLDSVRFEFPDPDRVVRLTDAVKADVKISNLGTEPVKVGIAIAVFDDDGNLVGVASGGSTWLAIKPDRTSFYTVKFADVNDRMDDATRFRITLETK